MQGEKAFPLNIPDGILYTAWGDKKNTIWIRTPQIGTTQIRQNRSKYNLPKYPELFCSYKKYIVSVGEPVVSLFISLW